MIKSLVCYVLIGMLGVFVLALKEGESTNPDDELAAAMFVVCWPVFLISGIFWLLSKAPIALATKIREWVRR